MLHWTSRKRIVWFSVAAVVLLLAIALVFVFVAPPAHDLNSAGATALNVSVVHSNAHLTSGNLLQPSQSISDIRCEMWRRQNRATGCPDDVASKYFPGLAEGTDSLYIPWEGCGWRDWRDSQGYNVEFIAAARKLVIHCYAAESLISLRPPLVGVAAIPSVDLLVLPANSVGPGTLEIVEDDRIERFVGDLSTEFRLATATIS